MKRSPRRTAVLRALAFLVILVAAPIVGAAAPKATKDAPPAYQNLVDAANAVVTVSMKAIPNARSNATLGEERTGSGVAIAPAGSCSPSAI